jgi:DNA-binding LacI/PurR family transcriptional regulator
MTALARHYRELGELAAGVLLDALRNGHDGDRAEIRVPLELVVRASCGC